RGATIQNILDFEEDFKKYGIKVFKLEQNYRSTEHIVQAANELITYNARQIPKRIWSDKGEGQRIRIIKAMTDAEEGKRVIDTIMEQKNRFHLSNVDIAILYRTNSQSRIFEEHLRRLNLNYRVYGGLSFYQRKEVKDLIAYLRLVVNPRDEEAFRRVINFPKRGIGDATVDKLADLANSKNISMWDALPIYGASGRSGKAIADFVDMITKAAKRADTANAYELATYIAKRSGLIDLLKADTSVEGINRMDNFNALLDGIKAFVEDEMETPIDTDNAPDKSLASYLQNIALLTDFDEKKTDGDHITLMSVHSAKGLEFKSVFVVGMEEKLFPSYMSMDSLEGLDEERRLFYVAITRAEQFLTLSYANARYRYGSMRYNEPSRFLEEVPRQNVESTAGLRSAPAEFANFSAPPSGASVKGNFSRSRAAQTSKVNVDPASFKPSPHDDIQAGMKVLHLKFGEGKVISIDGGKNNRVATIFFKDVENPQRRIMLKFAKLQILT
ncbi:MAG: ATP-binding domain-containing protein, partial [Lewinella sp.]|nr:ATP-binding domain-containing protein [Lewinella sp.]